MTNDPKTNKYYAVVAREEYKEEDVFFYYGSYSTAELEKKATEEVRENTTIEYVHIDFIFESDSPIKWVCT